MNKPFKRSLPGLLATTLLAFATAGAIADPVTFYWTDWHGSDTGTGFRAQGTITTPTSSVTVTYTNSLGVSFYQNGVSGNLTDYYSGGSAAAGTSPYTGSLVANRPPAAEMIALNRAGTQTLEFSEAIANPAFAFVSLNSNGYAFDQDFEILSLGGVDGNACGFWGCGGATKEIVDVGGVLEYRLLASNVGGSEPHGTLRFTGTFDEVSWRSLTNENWNGFTVGVQGTAVEVCETDPTLPGCDGGGGGGGGGEVPEPGSLALLTIGLLGLAAAGRRRR